MSVIIIFQVAPCISIHRDTRHLIPESGPERREKRFGCNEPGTLEQTKKKTTTLYDNTKRDSLIK